MKNKTITDNSEYVLGIACYYHDSSAAILHNGNVVAAAQEERFTRVKHDFSFPTNAIKYCLEEAGVTAKELKSVVFYEKPLLKFDRVLRYHVKFFPRTLKVFLNSIPDWVNNKLRVKKKLKKLGYRGDVLFVPHHYAHAGSFFASPFKKAAIVSVDGVGEWATTLIAKGWENKITPLKELHFPHSLGLLYSAITAYLGFKVNNSEYKVMGLAAYGNPDSAKQYYKKLMKVIKSEKDGAVEFDMSYFTYEFSDRMPSKKLCDLLGGPVRTTEEIDQRHMDIAAALQMLYEYLLFGILKHAKEVTDCDCLVLSGGCGLNSVANGKILKNTGFNNVWSQPDPGDGGTSLGAALYAWCNIFGNMGRGFENAYLGPEYSHNEIMSFLVENGIKFSRFENVADCVEGVAKMLMEDKVVGWFQGRMEWGPRALGARSILSNATNPDMQNILNLKVKHREKFRPFAPVVCVDDVDKFFVVDKPLLDITRFMLTVYPIKEEWHERLPSVTHVDGSGRLQVVDRESNALYYDLIKKFGELSGVPVLVNTSFNIRGEPIVMTPADAFKCMMGTEIDCLVMGNFLIRREDNMVYAWDGEKVAKD